MPTSVSIEITRPPGEVFAYVTDPSRFVEWQDGIVSGDPAGDGTRRVGGRFLTARRIGFVERPVTSEVTLVDPPRAWSVRGTDGPVRAAVEAEALNARG
jgi:uncharacterized protein YndB with AHSA1/START domain